MQYPPEQTLIHRLTEKIGAIADWLDEIEGEVAGQPLTEARDLRDLHEQLATARRSLEKRLAKMLGDAPADASSPEPDPFADLLRGTDAEARRAINDACARAGRLAPDEVAIADGSAVVLSWTESGVSLTYGDLRAACDAIAAG
ncbi:MAG TPA: hypothetical protein VGE52_02380 [Pirellulales bacterium]